MSSPIAKQVIHECGGAKTVAEALSTDDNPLSHRDVYYWHRAGIPTKYWVAVQRLRQHLGLPFAPREAFPLMVQPPLSIDGDDL